MGCPRDFLEPDKFYHIYNHANGYDKLFREEKNYYFFMQKIENYIVPCFDIHSYCLIPNHFHFAVKVKSEKELSIYFEEKINTKFFKLSQKQSGYNNIGRILPMENADHGKLKLAIIEQLLSEQFSHCFNSYVQSYNKIYNRMGSLLKESFQRNYVDSERYLKTLICYIHNNPVNHGIVKSTDMWKHSSYNTMFTDTPTFIKRKEVIDLFGTLENLAASHKERIGKKFYLAPGEAR